MGWEDGSARVLNPVLGTCLLSNLDEDSGYRLDVGLSFLGHGASVVAPWLQLECGCVAETAEATSCGLCP
jgi:hypothetical protein